MASEGASRRGGCFGYQPPAHIVAWTPAALLLLALSGRKYGLMQTTASSARFLESVTGVATMDSEWISTTQATRILSVTAAKLYRLINDGQIRAYRFGRVIRIKAADLDAYIESKRHAARSSDQTQGGDRTQ